MWGQSGKRYGRSLTGFRLNSAASWKSLLIFGEREPMRADTDFQTQIEPPSKFDLFICLLWARLGSRLHPALHRKPDGTEYASGTEYELLDALEGFRRSNAPEVMIYKRKGDPVIPAKPKEERERVL